MSSRRPTGRSGGLNLEQPGRSGFPAARSSSDPSLFLDGYAALVAQRAGDEGRDASRLLTTLRVLATLEAQAVPDQRIWEAADINKSTWKAYDDLLARTHVTAPSGAFHSNRLKRLTSYPKRCLADIALSLALAGVDAGCLGGDPVLAGRYLDGCSLPHCESFGLARGRTVFWMATQVLGPRWMGCSTIRVGVVLVRRRRCWLVVVVVCRLMLRLRW